jgi:hypothetical protein
VAAAWVAAGALFKLLSGSPNDLPPMVREAFLDPVTTFRLAIGLELCIVLTAVFRPRLGWIPLALLFVVFDLVLVPLVAEGASSCGCFGSRVPITPVTMMAIDTALLLAMLVTRPWSAFAGRRWSPMPLLPLFALAAASPWYFFRTASGEIEPRPRVPQVETSGVGTEARETSSTTGGTKPGPLAAATSARIDFHNFVPESWVGRDVFELDLARFLDVEQFPPDCEVVFYRQTCDHCREHLEALSLVPPEPETPRVLVRVPDPGDTPENEVTTVKPEHLLLLELETLKRGYGGLKTPADIRLDEWVVLTYEEIEHE